MRADEGSARRAAVPAHAAELGDVTSPPHWQGDGVPTPDELPAPLFQLGRVQYALPASLVQLAVASNRMVLCLPGGHAHDASAPLLRLVCLDLDDPARACEATVPMPPVARTHRGVSAEGCCMFVDPSAEHVLLSLASGHNFYWTPSWSRARLLPRLAGLCITSAAWGKSDAPPSLGTPPAGRRWVCTPPVLLGTARGEVWELTCAVQVAAPNAPAQRGDFFDRLARKTAGGAADYTGAVERSVHRVFVLSEPQRIAGLALQTVQKDAREAYIVAATPTRLYEFSGTLGTPGDDASVFDAVFQPYRDTLLTHLKIELPSELAHTALLCTAPPMLTGARRALVWLTGAGLFHAELNLARAPPHSFLEKTGLLAYPSYGTPLFLARTAFHYVLVYAERVVCVHVMDEHVAWDEALPLGARESVVGVTMDETQDTCWIYTQSSILELIVSAEDRDVWHILLERHAYDDALQYAPNAACASLVYAARGDAMMQQGAYRDAADAYAQTADRTFEQVVLALVEHGAHEGLRAYVLTRLEQLPPTAKTQRLMLATWLVEMYLDAMNRVEDEVASHGDSPSLTAQQHALDGALRAFFATYPSALDPKTTYAILARHGRDDMWLAYAEAIRDTRQILTRWVRQEQWATALTTLASQSDVELYYHFAPILMSHAPAETVQCWERQAALDPARLVPALLQHRPAPGAVNYSVQYLQHVTTQGNTAPAVHNLLITLLAERASDDKADETSRARANDALQQAIEGSKTAGRAYYDRNYALRICARKHLHDACVRLYARMDRHENAVHLALEAGDMELACRCAELATDHALRKELWLKCAQHVIRQEHGIQSAMEFLQRTSLLTLEDILPLFPDFVVIDGFKEEICDTLETYVTQIDALKSEMDRTTHTAELIQQDILSLSTRFLHMDADQACEDCGAPLLQRQMYLFPCRHGFHADCLTKEVTQHLPPRLLRRLLQLQEELAALTQGGKEPETADTSQSPALASLGASVAQGLSGTLKLDRLREHVRPQAIVDAISTGFSVGVASGRRVLAPLDPFAEPVVHARSADDDTKAEAAAPTADVHSLQMLANVDAVRSEMNTIVAGACPVCTLSVQHLALPFVEPLADPAEEETWAV